MHNLGIQRPKPWSHIAEAGIAATGMCLFGLFIHSRRLLVFLAVFGLLMVTIAIQRSFRTESSPAGLFGLFPISQKTVLSTVLGAIIGLGLGVTYRMKCGWDLFPGVLTQFALIAALIGAAEELLYRGYIQGQVRGLGPVWAIVCPAICHTGYKCLLFVFPPFPIEIDYLFIVTWTVTGGLIFGALREHSRSVLPPLAAHVCFDIIVYGGCLKAPWWVWG